MTFSRRGLQCGLSLSVGTAALSCGAKPNAPTTLVLSCCDLPARSAAAGPVRAMTTRPASTAGMRWIPAGTFDMGAGPTDADARADEKPVRRVTLDGYWVDETPVTNAQFRVFVDATGYKTTAEKPPVLEEIMKQLPPGTKPPAAEMLVAASLVFTPPGRPVSTDDASQWWAWVPGANWRQPQGPGSTIEGRDDHAVVQVSWDDASAYAAWAGKSLPTEAQWERAARGNLSGKKYAWGDADPTDAAPVRNTWQGHFPDQNTAADGFVRTSPVRAFAPNGIGLYDTGGNVWQWCADWYRADAYRDVARANPAGPRKSFDPAQPSAPVRVLRGGSFLCHKSYCLGYRVAARMKSAPDTSTDHVGFRCVIVPAK